MRKNAAKPAAADKPAGTAGSRKSKTQVSKGESLLFNTNESFRTLVENINEVVFTLDKAGRILYISPVIKKITRLRAEDMTGSLFDEFVSPEDRQNYKKSFKRTLSGEQVLTKLLLLDKQGEPLPVYMSGKALVVKKKTIGVMGTLKKTADTKRTEDILNEAGKYKNLVERIPAAVYIDEVDEYSTTIYMSPQIERITGYTAEEWVSDQMLWLNAIHPDDRAAVEKENLRTNQTGEPFQIEYRVLTRDNRVVWVRDEAVILKDADGKPVCWQGVMLDITNRKVSEQAHQVAEQDLRAREEQYRQMVELSPEAIVIHSDGVIVYVNETAKKLIGGQHPESIIGEPITKYIHPDSLELVAKRIQKALSQQKAVPATEAKFLRPDGTIVTVEVATMPIPYQGRTALQTLVRDVTEQRQADALQDAVYKIAMATEATKSLGDLYPRIHEIISSVMPAENFYITLYDRANDLLEFPYFKDAKDEPFLGHLQPGKGLTAYVLRTGKSLLCTQEVHDELERKGEIKLLGVPSAIWLGVPLIIEGKTIGAMVVQHYSDPKAYSEREQHMLEYVSTQVATAITRKQAEEALSNSETSYRGLFNNVMEAIYIQDRKGVFLDVNDGAVKMYGYSRQEFIGKTPADISAPGKNDLEALKRMIDLAFKGEPQQFEFWGKRKNGEIFPKDVRISLGKYYEQDVIIAVAQDITERKGAEEALQRQLKELSTLQAIALAGTETVSIDDLLERLTKIIVETFSLDCFGVMLYDEREKILINHPSYYGERTSGRSERVPLGKGVTGQAAESGLPIRIDNVHKHKGYIDFTPGMKSEICVPIKTGNELLGVINAESRHLNHFSDSDERLFVAIAGSLATAIQKLRFIEAEHTRRQEADNLRQAAAVITSSLSLEDVLEAILVSLRKVVSYDSASVILKQEEPGVLEIVAGHELPEGYGFIGKRFVNASLWEQLVKSHKPLIVPDTQKDERFVVWEGTEYIRGWMVVPLIIRDDVIGYLSIDNRKPDAYTEEQATLAQNFAYPAAIAVENARLYESERRRREEAETLRQAAAAVSSSLELRQVLDTILITLKKVIPYDSASIMLLEGDRLRLMAVQGFPNPEEILSLTFPAKDPLFNQTKRTKKPLILEDACQDPRFNKWAGTDYVRGWMGAPLIVRDEVIGYVTINSRKPAAYNEESSALVTAFANQVATAIENARLFGSEQQRRKEEEILRQAVTTVASTLNPVQSIQLILEQLERVVPYDSASVQILQKGAMTIVGGRGWKKPEAVLGISFPIPADNPNSLVVEKRQPVILGRSKGKFRGFEEDIHKHIKSWMGVPLISKNEVIGMLAVDSTHENNFNEESARMAGLFAGQVATALENTRLYEEALRAAERRAVLHRASQEIVRAVMNPEQIYKTVHQAAEQLMPAEAFVISLLDEANNEVLAAYLYDKTGRWPAIRTQAGVGLSGRIIETGRAVNITDVSMEGMQNGIHFGDENEEVQSILAVPMRLGEKIIGMLSAQSYQPHMYTEEDQALLEMLAAHAAVAIENSRLYNETQQRLTELEVVNRISTTLREAQSVPEMLPKLLDDTLGVLQSNAGAIWLYDSTRQVLKAAAARGWFTNLNDLPIAPGDGIAGAVYQTGEAFLTKEFSTEPKVSISSRKFFPAGWGGVCVPIRTLQETIGVLFFAVQSPRQVQPEETRLLTTICEITGNALRRADLYYQTQRQVQRLASLRAIDMAINTILDLRVTLGILIDHIQTQLKVDAVDVLLLNSRTQTLSHAASSGFRTDSVNFWQVHIGDDIAGKSVRTRSTIYLPNIAETTLSKRFVNLASEHFRSYVCIPLVAKGQVKGVLEIFHRSILEPDADWKNFLETLAGQAAIAIDNSVLFEDLQRSNVDLALAYDATIEGWSKALDLRDRETEGHTQRVTELTLKLAQLVSVSDPDQVHIRRGALLHDIGKMGVPDNILNKTSALDEKEWSVMRRHPIFAYEMLYPINYLRPAVDIPYCHHERWNGKGYPRGLRGEEIPLAARLFAVVDVWDALISDRPYRKAWTRKEATKFIQDNSGNLFDPTITEIFLTMMKGELE